MRERYGEIAKYILLGVGVAGVIVVVAAAPGIVLAGKLFEDALKHDKRRFAQSEKQKAARALRRLEKNRLLKIQEKNGKFSIELTKEGKRKFKEINLEDLRIIKPPRWDGKWRLVIFDIPEEGFASSRRVLRAKLKEWEFYPLQKSVWVCPWPCEKEIQTIAELYGVARYVDVVVAEKITKDVNLRKHFGL